MTVLLRTLAAALDAPGAPARGEHLLVAVSGGPDSTALLAALAELAPARGLRLTAAHVEHGLRGAEGTADAARAGALADEVRVPCVIRAVTLRPGSNLEAAARRARYRALAAVARSVGATRIVTAHTLDDQAETLLLRLLRGAGRGGLAGMRPLRGRLFRPLLEVTRADVRRFLAERGLGFAVDRMNADLRFARTRVRRLLLPFLAAEFNPRLPAALAGLAARLGDEEDFLAAAAAERARALGVGEHLPVAVGLEPPAVARRIVRAWLARHGGREPGAAHVERALALAAGRARGPIAVPGPGRLLREGDRLVRRAGRSRAAASFTFPIVPGGEVAHDRAGWRLALSAPRARRPGEERAGDAAHALFDADALPEDLVVRSAAAGDRVRVLGGPRRKLQDVLVDAKIPREARTDVPVLAAEDEILWVAGVVRGAAAALGPATGRVVEGVLTHR